MMGIFSFFAACGRSSNEALPEITSGPDEGWHDLTFHIRDDRKLEDGRRALEACGVHHGREVGLVVVLGPAWPAVILSGEVPFTAYKGVITFRSSGQSSDALVQTIDELYGTALNPRSMRMETRFTAISLAGKPHVLEKGPAKIKAFYESEDQDRYAELFVNIDLPHRVLQLNEKDEAYRKQVVRALTAE
jgi:hypothetical protein